MLVKVSCLERVPRFKSQLNTFYFSLNFSLDLQCTCTTYYNVTFINDPTNRLISASNNQYYLEHQYHSPTCSLLRHMEAGGMKQPHAME